MRIGICWYIAGDASPEFMRSVNGLLPRDTYSVLVLDPSIAASQREILCRDLCFVRARSCYAERIAPDSVHCPLPEGYRILPIDRHLLEGNLRGAADLRERILHFWISMETYDRDGFGFAAVHESKVVSHSLTDYVCGDHCEIGVHTDSAHRLKGLGTHVASLTANEAFVRGLKRVG